MDRYHVSNVSDGFGQVYLRGLGTDRFGDDGALVGVVFFATPRPLAAAWVRDGDDRRPGDSRCKAEIDRGRDSGTGCLVGAGDGDPRRKTLKTHRFPYGGFES